MPAAVIEVLSGIGENKLYMGFESCHWVLNCGQKQPSAQSCGNLNPHALRSHWPVNWKDKDLFSSGKVHSFRPLQNEYISINRSMLMRIAYEV